MTLASIDLNLAAKRTYTAGSIEYDPIDPPTFWVEHLAAHTMRGAFWIEIE